MLSPLSSFLTHTSSFLLASSLLLPLLPHVRLKATMLYTCALTSSSRSFYHVLGLMTSHSCDTSCDCDVTCLFIIHKEKKRKEKENKIPIKSENKRKENKNCSCPKRPITIGPFSSPVLITHPTTSYITIIITITTTTIHHESTRLSSHYKATSGADCSINSTGRRSSRKRSGRRHISSH